MRLCLLGHLAHLLILPRRYPDHVIYSEDGDGCLRSKLHRTEQVSDGKADCALVMVVADMHLCLCLLMLSSNAGCSNLASILTLSHVTLCKLFCRQGAQHTCADNSSKPKQGCMLS